MSVPAYSLDFEREYLSIRRAEGRLYSDELLRQLPQVPRHHPLQAEWEIRARSARRLIQYLQSKRRPLQILDVGCGNGWLTARLSAIRNARVWGIDINSVELEQARRVFADRPCLHFEWATLSDEALQEEQFDVILFAASIQYFPDLCDLLKNCMNLLNPVGEIHILDSHIYHETEVQQARSRSRDYFTEMKRLGMQSYYHHHSYESLAPFKPKRIYSWKDYLPGRSLSFPWIRIAK